MTPAAEVEVDEGLVRTLIGTLVNRLDDPALAELADGPIQLLANGWDNVLFRLGHHHVARLPRRTLAVELVTNEQRWLPELAQRLPLPIPVPRWSGQPGADFPWPWSIVPWFDGSPVGADLGSWSPAALDTMADGLGCFLVALHQPSPPDAPANPFRGGPLAGRAERTTALLAEDGSLASIVGAEVVTRLARLWAEALAAEPWAGPDLWLHGDLHPLNLIGHDHRLTAVIDFGDITGGDPATDLAVAWWLFGPDQRRRFRSLLAALGHPADEATWTRAGGWAASVAAAILTGSDGTTILNQLAIRTLNTLAHEVA